MSHEEITHLDLFSGIGGFALAADRVWSQGVRHIFCDNDAFAREVLRKHWPEAPIFGDVRTLTKELLSANSDGEEYGGVAKQPRKKVARDRPVHILTGGFPCQPFSAAGRRRGEEDDRFLWPEMCRVIGEFRPEWVIAENVRGLLTQGRGVVFERVCTDLEALGYEVRPIVIPAVAVGAPHRRDRVWFVAHANRDGGGRRSRPEAETQAQQSHAPRPDSYAANAQRKRGSQGSRQHKSSRAGAAHAWTGGSDWSQDWLEVAARLCRVDDGVPSRMDRNLRLKALGNAIVPQVAEIIMQAIKATGV